MTRHWLRLLLIVAAVVSGTRVPVAADSDAGADRAWAVVDEALARRDSAAALEAAATLDGDARQRLERYIERRRGKAEPSPDRELYARIASLYAQQLWTAVATLVDATPWEPGTIVSANAHGYEAAALKQSGHPREGARARLAAARAAAEIAWNERALSAASTAGSEAAEARDLLTSRDAFELALSIASASFHADERAELQRNLGSVYAEMGVLLRSERHYRESIALFSTAKDGAGAALAQMNLGMVRARLGQFASALAEFDRADDLLKAEPDSAARRALAGEILMYRGVALLEGGAYELARAPLESTLAILEKSGDPETVAMARGNLALMLRRLERFAEAEAEGMKTLQYFEAHDRHRPDLIAQALGNLAEIESDWGHDNLAIRYQLGAIDALTKADANPNEILEQRSAFGRILRRAGQLEEALAQHEMALEVAERIGAASQVEEQRAGIALTAWAIYRKMSVGPAAGAKEAREALLERSISGARDCVASVEVAASGLGDVQRLAAQASRADVLDVGALASAARGRVEDVAMFLEAARGGSLREQLGGRERIWNAVIPESLAADEASARVRELDAYGVWLEASQSDDVKHERAARKVWDDARATTLAFVDRIQREERQAADLVYPRADPLDAIRSRLSDGDVLVEYALCEGESIALVVRRTAPPAVIPLGDTSAIVKACEDVLGGDPLDLSKLDALRSLVVTRLRLSATDRRLLVSPDGALSHIPFALLDESRTVAYPISGTVLGLLDAQRAKVTTPKSTKIVALADPDYAATVEAAATLRGRSFALGLLPLPGTREEALAVAPSPLLGRDATESKLREALKPSAGPLRAVLLACHGRLEEERPWLSALAMTAGGVDDGLLTVLEIVRMKIATDVVVLSACQSARGPAIKGESVLSLARAFMFAGSPRVIGSLWKVDDAATTKLMIQFFKYWTPGGMGAAECLRKAQAEVKAIKKWEHPRYWAAWVLWGLPD